MGTDWWKSMQDQLYEYEEGLMCVEEQSLGLLERIDLEGPSHALTTTIAAISCSISHVVTPLDAIGIAGSHS